MAIYHCSIKIFSRGKGASAVAKAAYRAAECLTSEYDGQTHDYTRKRGIVHKEILLPDHVPREYADRSVLWNAVEKAETPKNAQLAREIEIALTVELTREQNISLVRDYVQRHFVSAGMCADVCVHDKNDGNPHAHIMLTMRPIEPNGSWGAKSRKEYILDGRGERIKLKSGEFKTRKICTVDWNEPTKAEEWRAAWANAVNAELRANGFDVTIDHRSYERQGVEQIPTVHMGVAATQMESKGIRTERGDMNREIAVTNKQIRSLRARINKLSDWLKDEAANTAPPTLADVIINILERRGIHNLQSAAKILIFLQNNDIPDLAGLEKKVSAMRGDVNRIRTDLKAIERRIDTLDAHIAHSENFKKYRKIAEKRDALYAEYKTLSQQGLFSKGKAQKALEAADAFEWKHFNELQDFDDAEKYLRGVLQGRFDPKKLPITKWREELAVKTAEKDALYLAFNSLKSETQKVEQIRRSVTEIMRMESQEWTPKKVYSIKL